MPAPVPGGGAWRVDEAEVNRFSIGNRGNRRPGLDSPGEQKIVGAEAGLLDVGRQLGADLRASLNRRYDLTTWKRRPSGCNFLLISMTLRLTVTIRAVIARYFNPQLRQPPQRMAVSTRSFMSTSRSVL